MRKIRSRTRVLLAAVGRRMAEIRLFRGLTQEEVAEVLGWTVANYARYERGEKNATLDTILTIATGLDAPIATLFEPPTMAKPRPGRPKKSRG